MITRRQLVFAGTAALVGSPRVLAAKAAKYDLIIKGGRVIEPSRKRNVIRDVAIADGLSKRSRPTSRLTPPERSTRAASWWCPA